MRGAEEGERKRVRGAEEGERKRVRDAGEKDRENEGCRGGEKEWQQEEEKRG